MRTLSEIGVAIVGTGFMCAAHHEALIRVGVHVMGVLGSSAEKSRQAAARYGLARAYTDYAEVLSRSGGSGRSPVRPESSTPADGAGAALQAGKHVLCEKPLAMDSAEAAELVALAKARPELAAGVNYNNRFYPLCLEAREAVTRGEVGRLFHVTGSVTQDWLLYATDYNWRVRREEQGELRALADIGAHWLDLVHFVTGLEIEALCADFTTVHPVRHRPRGEVETFANKHFSEQETEPVAIQTDDYGAALLRFRGGARGCFFVSQVSPGRKYRVAFEIAGQNRTLAWNSEECERLWIGQREGANALLIRDPALLVPAARAASDYPGGHNEGYPDSFKMCFRRFYGYIATGDFTLPPPFPTFADGYRDIRLCEAILKSQREGKWVAVEGETG